MGDLPDWTLAYNNAGTVLFSFTGGAGSTFAQDVSANNSLIIRLDGTQIGPSLMIWVTWYTDATMSQAVQQQKFSCVGGIYGPNSIVVETPVYSLYVVITNNSPQNAKFTVIGASRVVTTARVLDDAHPAYQYTYQSSVTAGTPVTLVPADSRNNYFNSNGQTTLVGSAAVAGVFVCSYVNDAAAVSSLFFLTVAAGASASITLALPHGGVGFIFYPSATNGAPAINLFAAAAQL